MTLGSHQQSIGKSQVHLTPRWILTPLGPFFFDPCASSPRPWDIGTDLNYTEADNGLRRPWPKGKRGFMNPPFHRYQIAEWLRLFAEHGRGIVLVHARTETDWFRIIKESASALFFLDRRVIFLDEYGQPQKITNPKSKHYGKVANSGAPVLLASYGFEDCDLLASLPASSGDDREMLAGLFAPLVIPRSVLVEALRDRTWRELVEGFLTGVGAPVRVADLYRAFADHPKTKTNPNWQAKLRQALQRGAGVSVGRDQWVPA
jgi:hypothetical protein